MSSFKPEPGKADSARAVAVAYDERKVARMVAGGMSEAVARNTLSNAVAARAQKREERRLRGLHIREEG
jgi:hypothetical protein